MGQTAVADLSPLTLAQCVCLYLYIATLRTHTVINCDGIQSVLSLRRCKALHTLELLDLSHCDDVTGVSIDARVLQVPSGG